MRSGRVEALGPRIPSKDSTARFGVKAGRGVFGGFFPGGESRSAGRRVVSRGPMTLMGSIPKAGLVALLCLSCGGYQASASPNETLRAYSAAIEAGRAREAYDLLSVEAKKTIPFESFKRMLNENPDEIKELSRSLLRPSAPPVVTATVTPPGGQTLLLVYEEGAWRVDGSSIDLYSQATPERAVAAFVRAYDNRRFDVLLRFVPDDQKHDLSAQVLEKAWTDEQREDIERMMAALKAALPTARFETLGDRATMPYGSGGTLELLREHGLWKVEDLD